MASIGYGPPWFIFFLILFVLFEWKLTLVCIEETILLFYMVEFTVGDVPSQGIYISYAFAALSDIPEQINVSYHIISAA